MEEALRSLKNRLKTVCKIYIKVYHKQFTHTHTTFAREQRVAVAPCSEHEQWRQRGPLSPSGQATFTRRENPRLLCS